MEHLEKDRANTAFYQKYNGQPNPLTPKILYRGCRCGFAYEISAGKGMVGEDLFWVTFLKLGPNGPERTEFNSCCDSLAMAVEHVKETLIVEEDE